MLVGGYTGYLAYMIYTKQERGQKFEEGWIVYNYPDKFPEELLGITPKGEEEVEIKVIPSINPISKDGAMVDPTKIETISN